MITTDILYDVIIVGCGPAGMTAALYLIRANKKVCIIDKEGVGGNMAKAPYIENYPGFKGAGDQLATDMYEMIAKKVKFKWDTIENITKDHNIFILSSPDAYYCGKSVIWATGSEHIKLNVPCTSEENIHYCVTCDGPLYTNRTVAVIGDGNSAAQYALALTNYAKEVKLLTLTNKLFCEDEWKVELESNSHIKIIPNWNTIGFETVYDGVDIKNKEGKIISVAGVFIAIGQHANNSILKKLNIELDAKGYVITKDERGSTSLEGFYAIGDCRSKPYRQVSLACGDGAAVAMEIINWLK